MLLRSKQKSQLPQALVHILSRVPRCAADLPKSLLAQESATHKGPKWIR